MMDDIHIEIARVERESLRRINERLAAEQFGEIFEGLEAPE